MAVGILILFYWAREADKRGPFLIQER
jgi:hypothetical protein